MALIQFVSGIVLVADDSAVIRRIFSKYLDERGVTYQMCNDGEQALFWFQNNYVDCAAIVTDLEMPRMGGEALIANAKLVDPDVPCFIVSGNDVLRSNLPPGARKAYVKPISSQRVDSIIEEIYLFQCDQHSTA